MLDLELWLDMLMPGNLSTYPGLVFPVKSCLFIIMFLVPFCKMVAKLIQVANIALYCHHLAAMLDCG